MPVFNRLSATQKAILTLFKSDRSIPFTITVVDNGSESALVNKLREFHQNGIIDKLFILPRNMGIACACNVGWEMTPASVYCKMDNDTAPVRKDWIKRLFKLWSHGKPVSNLGYAATREQLLENPGSMHTEDGILGVCSKNLAGTGIFIPKSVSDVLGYWNEEYGPYGAEDGDYGIRMQCVDFPQYYYYGPEYIRYDLDTVNEAKYIEHGLDKKKEHKKALIDTDGKYGKFGVNSFMLSCCIRSPRVNRRYYIKDIDEKNRVSLGEHESFKLTQKSLYECRRILLQCSQKNSFKLYDLDMHMKLKSILRDCGQDMDSFVKDCLRT
ncbi:MAG: glycosyltransferase [Desulfovibrio sp.]|nr:glycosyltransferase [Desulfovibrio sp.]